jgi:hypothetical protein
MEDNMPGFMQDKGADFFKVTWKMSDDPKTESIFIAACNDDVGDIPEIFERANDNLVPDGGFIVAVEFIGTGFSIDYPPNAGGQPTTDHVQMDVDERTRTTWNRAPSIDV